MGYNVQATAPEQKLAQTSGWNRCVPSIRKPLYRDQQPSPTACARGLGKRGGEEEKGFQKGGALEQGSARLSG